MRRLAIAAVGLALVFGIALASDASAAPKEKSPFIGDWEALCPGSAPELSIRGGSGPLHLKLSDAWFEECPSYGPATGTGRGTLMNPHTLFVDFRLRCQSDKSKTTMETTFFLSEGDVNLLVDEHGLRWRRQ